MYVVKKVSQQTAGGGATPALTRFNGVGRIGTIGGLLSPRRYEVRPCLPWALKIKIPYTNNQETETLCFRLNGAAFYISFSLSQNMELSESDRKVSTVAAHE